MQEFTYTLDGMERFIHVPETEADICAFEEWVDRPRRAMAIDTETAGSPIKGEATGLDIFADVWRVRLVQFGDQYDAWVLDPLKFKREIIWALKRCSRYVCHNATFDVLGLDRAGLADMDELFPKVDDTRVLAHLLDPRAWSEGGTGHSLKQLTGIHVDKSAPDTAAGLYSVFRSLTGPDGKKGDKATGWALIPLDHPTYLLYAGLDVIFTACLLEKLRTKIIERKLVKLVRFEQELQVILARMERKGFLLDVEYTERLRDQLRSDARAGREKAKEFGVENINSTSQVADGLLAMGEVLTERTPTKRWKVDSNVLLALADLDKDLNRIGARDPNPLAEAVFHAKRANKWSASYAQAMLDLRDSNNRIHPSINSLQARTARMSIARPPLQQLPSGDWTIRRSLIADPGMVIVASDYSQVEMRVLAALAKDKKMLEAIASGMDIHDAVATILFGPKFTKHQRKLAKNTGFGKVFGGGAKTLARQSGTTVEVAQQARSMFDDSFPAIKRFSYRLVDQAEQNGGYVVSPMGRHLPLDKDRFYAATNYVVQSTARDVLAKALIDLNAAGLGDYLLLPVHDEVVAQAPKEDAEEVSRLIAATMARKFGPTFLDAEASVYGASWGHGYGAED